MAKRKCMQVEKGKTRVELRIENDIAMKLTKLADDAGVSLNQLVGGVMCWAVDHAFTGEVETPGGKKLKVNAVAEPGRIAFHDAPTDSRPIFELDFTSRGAVKSRVVVDSLVRP